MAVKRFVSIVVWSAVFLTAVSPTAASARVKLNAAEVEAWADDVFGEAFENRRFSGLAISAVQDGEMVFSKAYGYADYAAKSLIDPATTRFRIASISKTFAGTAIAQLVDRGLIASLDDPANNYLKRIQLPRKFDRDITIWHLLNHKSGFESSFFSMGARDKFTAPENGDELSRFMTKVVAPPGDRLSYSNLGVNLLGVLIEDVTGMTFRDYLAEYVFAPLGMDNTEVPYGTDKPAGLGKPYAMFPNGEVQPILEIELRPAMGPAGGLISTVTDIARYMLAHLDQGKTADNPLVSPAMFETMHSVHQVAGNNPGRGFGMLFFVEQTDNLHRIYHGGHWEGFESIMIMDLKSNAGIFIAMMVGDTKIGPGEWLWGLVGDNRMTPAPGIPWAPYFSLVEAAGMAIGRFFGMPPVPETTGSSHPGNFVGTYWKERRPHTTNEVFSEFLFSRDAIEVEQDGDTGLRINGQGPYREGAPGVFWGANSSQKYVFDLDDSGRGTRLFDWIADDTYTRVDGLGNPLTVRKLMWTLVIIAMTGLLWVIPAIRTGSGATTGRIGWLAPALPVLVLAIAGALTVGFGESADLYTSIYQGDGRRLLACAVLANFIVIVALCLAAATVFAWRNSYWNLIRRIHFTLIALTALGLIPVLNFGNMVGFNMP